MVRVGNGLLDDSFAEECGRLRWPWSQACYDVLVCLENSLRCICHYMRAILPTPYGPGESGPSTQELKFCFGNPDRTGCLNFSGTSVLWPVLNHRRYCALRVFDKLQVIFLDLASARLPAIIPPGIDPNLASFSRGGPSYNSCAAFSLEEG